MKLETQVCDLYFAELLKKLGVKQDSYFIYVGNKDNYEIRLSSSIHLIPANVICSTFTVSELGNMLLAFPYPADYKTRWYDNGGVDFEIQFSRTYQGKLSDKRRKIYQKLLKYRIDSKYDNMPKTEANARAKMLVYLLENKII